MSIMIKGIDMPINCTRCPCSDDGTRFCRAANEYIPMLGKPDFCPLEEAKERKPGHWIAHKWGLEITFECSECGCSSLDATDFCPDCGSPMKGAE